MPVTSLLAALFALMMVALSLPVSVRRRELCVGYGDGDDPVLRRRIRAHGNFIEYAPMMLVLLAMVEIAEARPWFIWLLAIAFLVSRLLHAAGSLYGRTPWLRGSGMFIQHTAFVLAGIYLLVRYFA